MVDNEDSTTVHCILDERRSCIAPVRRSVPGVEPLTCTSAQNSCKSTYCLCILKIAIFHRVCRWHIKNCFARSRLTNFPVIVILVRTSIVTPVQYEKFNSSFSVNISSRHRRGLYFAGVIHIYTCKKFPLLLRSSPRQMYSTRWMPFFSIFEYLLRAIVMVIRVV